MFPLLVLGMHRSGTSLAASLLASAGLHVGERLLGANASNPRGHHEDEDFVDLERAALRHLGVDGDGWVVADPPAADATLVAAARALLQRKAASGRVWGWKDPRTVPLLPLWQPLLPDARFAIVYRAPWDVADSLFRRGDDAFQANPELALHVWRYYNERLVALALAAPERCVVTSAEVVSAHPQAWVAHVAARLGVPLTAPDAALVDRESLHQTGAARADQIGRLCPDVAVLYARLERLAFRPAGSAPAYVAPRPAEPQAERRLVLADWAAAARASRRGRGDGLVAAEPAAGVRVPGWCPCCRQDTVFIETGPWLRDQFLCERCRSIPRFRAVNHVLDTYCAGWEHGAVLELSPPADFVGRYAAHYTSAHGVQADVAAVPAGAVPVERLPYDDAAFHVVVTQDLLEHVFAPEIALREIVRVLKPGGVHVCTAPRHRHLPVSRQRACIVAGAVQHLLPPEYHGDALDPGRQLVTWDFGADFAALVGGWSGAATTGYLIRDRRFGLDGEFLDVLVTRKAA